MDQPSICELNLALIPDIDLANRHITFSRHLADRYRSLIQLNGVTPSWFAQRGGGKGRGPRPPPALRKSPHCAHGARLGTGSRAAAPDAEVSRHM